MSTVLEAFTVLIHQISHFPYYMVKLSWFTKLLIKGISRYIVYLLLISPIKTYAVGIH